jgi:hypothetical protein
MTRLVLPYRSLLSTSAVPHAYQFGNTIIVEDEDGEVVKKYELPAPEKKKGRDE